MEEDRFEKLKVWDKSTWIKDKDVKKCFNKNCRKKFFFPFRRKHHCRMCGQIFCSKCTRYIIDENDVCKDTMIEIE